jgi:ketosteroid isomerase-like protein
MTIFSKFSQALPWTSDEIGKMTLSKTRYRFPLLLVTSMLVGATDLSAASAQDAAGGPISSQEQTNNKAIVKAALDAWMAGDGGAFQRLLSDDIEWTIAGNSAAAGITHGWAELMDKVLRPFGARFSQSSNRFHPSLVHGLYADGDTVIAYFDGAGTTNNGRPYRNSYVWLLTMRDGKVVRATAFFDSIAFDELWKQVPPAQN